MAPQALSKYTELIQAFVVGRIDAGTFEREYVQAFEDETFFFGAPIFPILDGLFADVDAYCADPGLRAAVGGLDEDQLRERCKEVLRALHAADPGVGGCSGV